MEENYSRDIRRMKERRADALDDFQKGLKSDKKRNMKKYKKCLEKNKRKLSAKERLRRYWTHGDSRF